MAKLIIIMMSGISSSQEMNILAKCARRKTKSCVYIILFIEMKAAQTEQTISLQFARIVIPVKIISPEAFSGNACAVMRKQDYYASIQTLANGATSLWGANPEDVVGIPVIFNDRAVTPVVGDFRYARQNYDVGAILDTDKDVKKGEYYFVLTAWGDHRIRIKNAFRLAKAPTAVG